MLAWAGGGCAAPEAPASITFILGEDRYDINPYYARAEAFYRQKNTPNLIASCRSLRAVCEYLVKHPPAAGRPWDSVHLVVHGTAWTGMGLPVLPGDNTRTTPATLAAAQAAGLLPPVPDRILNRASVVVLHGCALGRDSALLLALSATLGGADGHCPKVVSSRLFNIYEQEEAGIGQHQAEYWYVSYPTYQRPPDSILAQRLANKYPKNDLNWTDALRRRRPRWPGDAYWRPVVVPVHWIVSYPDSASRPALRTPEDQARWLAGQAELQAALGRLGLPAERFRWSFREANVPVGEGLYEPAIVLEGQTTACCVLRSVLPGVPAPKDHFFAAAQFSQQGFAFLW